MVDCLSLEKVMKKNEKLFALKQLFWFFKNWVVLMVLTANHINHDMVVLGHLTHTHHKPIGLYCPIGPSKTCWDTLYIKKSSENTKKKMHTKSRCLEIIQKVSFNFF